MRCDKHHLRGSVLCAQHSTLLQAINRNCSSSHKNQSAASLLRQLPRKARWHLQLPTAAIGRFHFSTPPLYPPCPPATVDNQHNPVTLPTASPPWCAGAGPIRASALGTTHLRPSCTATKDLHWSDATAVGHLMMVAVAAAAMEDTAGTMEAMGVMDTAGTVVTAVLRGGALAVAVLGVARGNRARSWG